MWMRHDQNHFGIKRSLRFMEERFYWKGMRKDVEELVESCWECQRRKKPRNAQGKMGNIEVQRKFERIQIDLYAGIPRVEGYSCIMVATDVLTKYVTLEVLRDKTPQSVARAMWKNHVKIFGFSEKVQTNQGKDTGVC